MKIINHGKIRKERNREEYRYTFSYETKQGVKTVSLLAPTREEAVRRLNFRLNGLKNFAN